MNDNSPAAGASFTLSATVRNDGDGAAAATTLRYYRSTDETITTSDTEVGTDAGGGLAAGATSSESINLTAPATAGTYYYGACVDAVTDESDTTNNCSTSVQITVPEPTPPPTTQEFHVWGDSGYTQYLGFFSCVFCTELDTNSINNEFGPYGNRFLSTSIRNEFSQYGSRFGTYSACNRFTSNPPRAFNQSKTVHFSVPQPPSGLSRQPRRQRADRPRDHRHAQEHGPLGLQPLEDLLAHAKFFPALVGQRPVVVLRHPRRLLRRLLRLLQRGGVVLHLRVLALHVLQPIRLWSASSARSPIAVGLQVRLRAAVFAAHQLLDFLGGEPDEVVNPLLDGANFFVPLRAF